MAPIICKVLNKFEDPLQGVYVMLECFKSGMMSSFDATTTEGGTIDDWLPSSRFIGEPSDPVPMPVDSKDYSSCRLVFMTCSHYGPNVNPWPYVQVDVRLHEHHDHSVRLCLSRHRYEVHVEVTPRPDSIPLAEQERAPIMAPLPSQPSLPSPWPPFLKEEALGYWPASPIPPSGMSALDCLNGLDNLGGVKGLEALGELGEPEELGEIGTDPGMTREPSVENDPDYRPPSPSACSEMSGVEHGPTVLLRPTNRAATLSNPLFGTESTVQPKRRGRPRKVRDGDLIPHGVRKEAKARRGRGRPAKNSM